MSSTNGPITAILNEPQPITHQLTILQANRARRESTASTLVHPTMRKPTWDRLGIQDKTLWDWLSLLLVPLIIGLGTIGVTVQQTAAQNALSLQLHDLDRRQHASDQQIAQQVRYDDLLRAYRDDIDTLLFTKNLGMSSPSSDLRIIAAIKTQDILQQVDPQRKEQVIQYLTRLGLVQGGSSTIPETGHLAASIISLSGTNLSGVDLSFIDLHGADLSRADLSEASLNRTNLDGANLSEATLSGASLISANLSKANLSGAHFNIANLNSADLSEAGLDGVNLSSAILSGANLSGADLSRAQLTRADLSGADLSNITLTFADLCGARGITNEELEQQASSLVEATMPDNCTTYAS